MLTQRGKNSMLFFSMLLPLLLSLCFNCHGWISLSPSLSLSLFSTSNPRSCQFHQSGYYYYLQHQQQQQHYFETLSSSSYPSSIGSRLYASSFSLEEIETTATEPSNDEVPPPPPPPPVGVLGPREPLHSLKICQSVSAFRQIILPSDNTDSNSADATTFLHNVTIERLSFSPDIFVLRDFLIPSERDAIIADAQQMEMAPAETITDGDVSSRKKCNVAWLPALGSGESNNNNHRYLLGMVQSVATLLLTNEVFSMPSAGVEDLQVLQYQRPGGEFVLHHDGAPRVLTVIYYLNGIGGTWFPLARTSNDLEEDDSLFFNLGHHANNGDAEKNLQEAFEKARRQIPQNKAQALQLGCDFLPGTHGLLVRGSKEKRDDDHHGNDGQGKSDNNDMHDPQHVVWVNAGDAVAFFNYLDDGSGRLDWRALHAGLPTSAPKGGGGSDDDEEPKEKWIANHWFRASFAATIPPPPSSNNVSEN